MGLHSLSARCEVGGWAGNMRRNRCICVCRYSQHALPFHSVEPVLNSPQSKDINTTTERQLRFTKQQLPAEGTLTLQRDVFD